MVNQCHFMQDDDATSMMEGIGKTGLRKFRLLEDKINHLPDQTISTDLSVENQGSNHSFKEFLSLKELVQLIKDELSDSDPATLINTRTRIKQALEKYKPTPSELDCFTFYDRSKNYTRNLIATDHKTYSLMLLCWNRGKFSPIHDHPCDGCWLKVIKGTVEEIKYEIKGDKLVETEKIKASDGVLFINDSIGLHKVGNPSNDVDAMSLHLYAPPFDKCRLWLNDSSSKASVAVSSFYSEYGEKLSY